MSDIMVWMVAAIGGEMLLMLLVLLAFSWFRNRAAGRRDVKAMQVLVTRIKNTKNDREAAIGRFLTERMAMSGDALEQAKSAMLRAELVLLQRFANLYRKRDAGAAAQFDIDLAATFAPYHELCGSGGTVAGAPDDVDPSELNALRAENKRLSDELSVTMGTMSRMLNEYSTMFAGGGPDEAVETAAQAADDSGAGEIPGSTNDVAPQDEIDVLFEEPDDGSPPAADTGDCAQEAVAGIAAEQPDDPVEPGPEAQQAAVLSDPVENTPEDDWEVSVESADTPAIEIELGDDLDGVSMLLEEGPVEVMSLDAVDERDAGVRETGDDLFDAADAHAEAAPDDTDATPDEVGHLEGEDLFDAGEEPLRTRSGG